MPDVALEMHAIVRFAAEPPRPGETAKAAIRRAARRLRISYRRAYTFWYRQPAAVRAEEADALRAARLDLLALRQRQLEHELLAIRAELNEEDPRATPVDGFRAPVAQRNDPATEPGVRGSSASDHRPQRMTVT